MASEKEMVEYLTARRMPAAVATSKRAESLQMRNSRRASVEPLLGSAASAISVYRAKLEALNPSELRELYEAAVQRESGPESAVRIEIPETLTSVRGAAQREQRAIPAPDWTRWRHMRDVELWEAVALSLNMEPASLPAYLGAYEAFGDDPFRICPLAFQDRLQIAISNAGIRLPIKPVHALRARCLVDLPTFGAWAANIWEPLPQDLPTATTAWYPDEAQPDASCRDDLPQKAPPVASGIGIESSWTLVPAQRANDLRNAYYQYAEACQRAGWLAPPSAMDCLREWAKQAPFGLQIDEQKQKIKFHTSKSESPRVVGASYLTTRIKKWTIKG